MKKTSTLTRRQFLRHAVIGVGAATLGACGPAATTESPAQQATQAQPATVEPNAPATAPAQATATVAEAAAPAQAPVVEAEVTTSGWPLNVYTEEELADPNNKAISDAINVWLEQHPGVTLVKKDVNIWDPQTIQAQVAGGTDVTYLFGPCVGGGWGRQEAVNAFVQGMLADVTPAVTKYGLQGKVQDFLWNSWSPMTQVDGQYWAYPLDEFAPGVGTFVYRKDMLTEAGVEMPKNGWTWQEAADTFKKISDPANGVYGLAAATWFLGYMLSFHGSDILTRVPAPEQNWKWQIDYSDPRWAELADQYRALLHQDKAIISGAEIQGDDQVSSLFREGKVGFGRLNYWSMFGSPSDPNSFAALADRLNKPYSEVFGVVAVPTGDGYQIPNGAQSGGVSFSPNSTPEQIDMGVGLVDWMFWDKGLDLTKAAAWETTQDPRSVYSAFMYMSGRTSFEGVPGSAADAWGEEVVNSWYEIAKIPVEPQRDEFFPPEQNPSPSSQAIDDQFSLMVSDPNAGASATLLQKAQDDWTAAAQGFTTSVTTEKFITSAQNYYAALTDYLKANMPDFYESRFQPFYEAKVAPVIS